MNYGYKRDLVFNTSETGSCFLYSGPCFLQGLNYLRHSCY